MDIYEAAYRVAHDYPGGAVKLAAKMGENPGTFLNRVNPETETHRLYLATAVQMQAISGDHRILHAMAGTLGEVCFAIPDLSKVSDASLLETVCAIGREGGDFHREIQNGLGDVRFSRARLAKIRKEGLEFIAAIAETMARIEGMVDE